MFKSIIAILNLLVSSVTLYMVIMSNQDKSTDISSGITKLEELTASSPSEEISHEEGNEGTNPLDNNLKMGLTESFKLSPSYILGRNRSSLKSSQKS